MGVLLDVTSPIPTPSRADLHAAAPPRSVPTGSDGTIPRQGGRSGWRRRGTRPAGTLGASRPATAPSPPPPARTARGAGMTPAPASTSRSGPALAWSYPLGGDSLRTVAATLSYTVVAPRPPLHPRQGVGQHQVRPIQSVGASLVPFTEAWCS